MLEHELSLAAAAARLKRPVTSRPRSRSSSKKTDSPRVLLVEDDFIMATDIEAALIEAGFDVVGVSATADEAVSMAAALRPSIVIMDIHLSGKRDGVDAAIEIYSTLRIRSVFATAHHDGAIRARAAPSQPIAWLPKPYSTDLLVSTVRRAMEELGR
jgi:two-component system, response regulator PdtaR